MCQGDLGGPDNEASVGVSGCLAVISLEVSRLFSVGTATFERVRLEGVDILTGRPNANVHYINLLLQLLILATAPHILRESPKLACNVDGPTPPPRGSSTAVGATSPTTCFSNSRAAVRHNFSGTIVALPVDSCLSHM
jgi:hypothetical protein